MSKVISRHNKKILKSTEIEEGRTGCNCQKAYLPCIMGGKCLDGNVIYQGSVKRDDTGHTETYTGLTEKSFKLRLGNHRIDFKTPVREMQPA